MGEKKIIKAIIEGGAATGGPPLGPALGPLGVNIKLIVDEINQLTREYGGMKVPIEVVVDVETKEFQIIVKTPTTSALIAKEAGIEKGSGSPGAQPVGDITMEQVLKIARIKEEGTLSKTLKACVKEIIGTCVSMGITIGGENPKDILERVKKGEYDHLLE
jgi:large subunit ribosomal protein L11